MKDENPGNNHMAADNNERVEMYDDVKIIQIIPARRVRSWLKAQDHILNGNEVCLRIDGSTIVARETTEFSPSKGEDLIIVNTFEHPFTFYFKNFSKDYRTFYSHMEGYVNMINNDQILNATKILIGARRPGDPSPLLDYSREYITTFNLSQLINYIMQVLESKIKNTFYEFTAMELDKDRRLIDGQLKYRLENEISEWAKHCCLRVNISNIVIDDNEYAMQKARENRIKNSLKDVKKIEDIQSSDKNDEEKTDDNVKSAFEEPQLPQFKKEKSRLPLICAEKDIEYFKEKMPFDDLIECIPKLIEFYESGCL